MISPLGYLDYRTWLRDLYEARRRTDAYFSYRYMAGKVGTSHPFLIRVLQGQRHIAEETVDRFIEFLRLQDREAEYFRVLVRFGRTPSEAERRTCLERLLALQGMRMAPLDLDAVDYFRGWLPAALRSLVVIAKDATDEQLAEMLTPSVPAAQVRETLDRLVSMGMIRREDDRWIPTEAFVQPGPEIAPLVVRNHQREVLHLASEALDRHPPELRYVASATFSIDMEDLQEAQARLKALRDSLLQLSAESRRPDIVMNLGLALYPVAMPGHASSRGRRSTKR